MFAVTVLIRAQISRDVHNVVCPFVCKCRFSIVSELILNCESIESKNFQPEEAPCGSPNIVNISRNLVDNFNVDNTYLIFSDCGVGVIPGACRPPLRALSD